MASLAGKLDAGLTHHRSGRLEAAESLYREVLSEDPSNAQALCLVGTIAVQSREYDLALEYLQRAIEVDPTVPVYHLHLASAYRSLKRVDKAIYHLREAITLDPNYAPAHNNLGLALEETGQSVKAQHHYHRAVAINPRYAPAYLHLAELKRFRVGDPMIQQVKALLKDPALPPGKRADLHFALAKIYDDCDEYENAFTHARMANHLGRQDYDIKERIGVVDSSISFFTKKFFETRMDLGCDSELPVFVIGMPRSGKSLVEHLLKGHPEIHGAGELPEIRHIVSGLPSLLGTDAAYPRCLEELDRDTAHRVAGCHVNTLQDLGGTARRVVDTIPGNLLRLGLIGLLFPKAKIIHVRRNPMASGLACYLRNMNVAQKFTSNLTHFGQFYNQYARIMAHWKAVLPCPMLEINYEDLVLDSDKTSREIIEFCGLEWSSGCLAKPYRSRPISLDSETSGGSPADRRYLDRWRHYESYLEPLKTELNASHRGANTR